MHICMYIYRYYLFIVYKHIYVYACFYAGNLYVCIYTYMFISMQEIYMYIYIYTYISMCSILLLTDHDIGIYVCSLLIASFEGESCCYVISISYIIATFIFFNFFGWSIFCICSYLICFSPYVVTLYK
jgi:hypothetical protein